MEKILNFFKKNIFGFAIAIPVFIMFLYFTYKGNRICDCKSTQKFENANTSHRGSAGVHRFYHK